MAMHGSKHALDFGRMLAEGTACSFVLLNGSRRLKKWPIWRLFCLHCWYWLRLFCGRCLSFMRKLKNSANLS